MIFATIIFLIAGLGFEMWEKCWSTFPVGGMLCGVVVIVIRAIYGRDR